MRPDLSLIPERERIETPKRGRLTKRETAALMLSQDGKCACGCGRKLARGNYIAEHVIPLALGGASKPDALYHKYCAGQKTKNDVKNSAKVRRLRGETGRRSGRKVAKISSKGFDKRFRRKMDGTVEERR